MCALYVLTIITAGLDFSPILTHYVFLGTTIAAVVCHSLLYAVSVPQLIPFCFRLPGSSLL